MKFTHLFLQCRIISLVFYFCFKLLIKTKFSLCSTDSWDPPVFGRTVCIPPCSPSALVRLHGNIMCPQCYCILLLSGLSSRTSSTRERAGSSNLCPLLPFWVVKLINRVCYNLNIDNIYIFKKYNLYMHIINYIIYLTHYKYFIFHFSKLCDAQNLGHKLNLTRFKTILSEKVNGIHV